MTDPFEGDFSREPQLGFELNSNRRLGFGRGFCVVR